MKIKTPFEFSLSISYMWMYAFILFASSLTGQEVVNVTKLNYRLETIGSIYQDPHYLYRSGDKFYFFASAGESYKELQSDIEVDSFLMPLDTFGNPITSTVMFEYELGEGFTDYTFFDYADMFYDVSFDGSLVAFSLLDNVTGINGDLFLGSEDSIVYESLHGGFVIYDMESDSILYKYFSSVNSLNGDEGVSALFLDGEYIYVETRTYESYTFLGDTIYDFDIDSFSKRKSTLHKVNWKTNEKLWSKQIGDIIIRSPIKKINVDSSGNINLVVKQWGSARYDEMVLDSANMPGLDMVLYRLDKDGNLLNFERYDHNTSSNIMYDYEFDKDGSLMVYGALFAQEEGMIIENNGDSIVSNHDFSSALIMKIGPDLKLDWYKLINGTVNTGSFYSGFDLKGNSLSSFILHDTLQVDSTLFVSNYDLDSPDYYGNMVIAKLSSDGEFLSSFQFGRTTREINTIHEIDKDHYILLLENFGTIEPIFDTEFGEEEGPKDKYILEIRGDVFDVLSSLGELELKEKTLNVHPNPSNQEYIYLGGLPVFDYQKDYVIKVHDLQGNLVLEKDIKLTSDEIQLDISLLKVGIFQISIFDGENYYSSKFMKY